MRVITEGSIAVAETVARCRPQLTCAYPITPQTHIVEHLAKLASDGKLEAGSVLAESEFGAASIVLGASAVGARTYTATSSPGTAADDRSDLQHRRHAPAGGDDLR